MRSRNVGSMAGRGRRGGGEEPLGLEVGEGERGSKGEIHVGTLNR